MSIDTLIMLAGGFVAALPFFGFPNSWDNVFFFAAGVCVIALGIMVRRRGASGMKRTNGMAHFEENRPVKVETHETT